MAKEDGPLLAHFDKEFDNCIRQELTTYYVRDGVMIKETVERNYSNDGDYLDSINVQPLVSK